MSSYIVTQLEGGELKAFLSPQRSKDLEAAKYAVARGLSAADVVGMDLPDANSVDKVLDLSRRGLAEIAEVL
jgi:hypothetical protein